MCRIKATYIVSCHVVSYRVVSVVMVCRECCFIFLMFFLFGGVYGVGSPSFHYSFSSSFLSLSIFYRSPSDPTSQVLAGMSHPSCSISRLMAEIIAVEELGETESTTNINVESKIDEKENNKNQR